MIDFDRKPTPKSENEKRFDELNAKYTEKFGVPYVFSIGIDIMTWEEAIADIQKRITTGEKQPGPDYDPDNMY